MRELECKILRQFHVTSATRILRQESSYKDAKLVKFVIESGIVPVNAFDEMSLKQNEKN